MCTVTFWPRRTGFRLGMNRDEQWTRPVAFPTIRRQASRRQVLCPVEAGGGTWIGLNDAGVAFALVNWYSVAPLASAGSVSRGRVVEWLLSTSRPVDADSYLAVLPLKKLKPFRVVGIFQSTRAVMEWRWNGNQLQAVCHPWEPRQWISSGLNEPTAQEVRSEVFRRFSRRSDAGDHTWLRTLHGSHLPKRGPFSHCVHRDDAGTVSYSEITVIGAGGAVFYQPGCPCEGRVGIHSALELMPEGGL